MNRGDVWLLDLGGQAGRRPAVIASARRGYPTDVAVGKDANLAKDSFVTLDNVQTVSKARFVKYVGSFDDSTMRAIGRKAILAPGLEDV